MLGTACGGRNDGAGGRADWRTAILLRPRPRLPPSDRPAIVFLGTSLTAGYGLGDPALAYPALIQAKLDSAGRPLPRGQRGHQRRELGGRAGAGSTGSCSRIRLRCW